MIANTSGVLLRTMLFLVTNNHPMTDKRLDTNTLYHIKTGESEYLLFRRVQRGFLLGRGAGLDH